MKTKNKLGIGFALLFVCFLGVIEFLWFAFLTSNGGHPIPDSFLIPLCVFLLCGFFFHLINIRKWKAIDHSSWRPILQPTAKTLVFGAPFFLGMLGITLTYFVLCGSFSIATVLLYFSSRLRSAQFTISHRDASKPDTEPTDLVALSKQNSSPIEGSEGEPPSELLIESQQQQLAGMEVELHQYFHWIEWGSSFVGCLITLAILRRLQVSKFWSILTVSLMSLVSAYRSARKSDQNLPEEQEHVHEALKSSGSETIPQSANLQSGPIINLAPEWADCIPVLLGALVFGAILKIRQNKNKPENNLEPETV